MKRSTLRSLAALLFAVVLVAGLLPASFADDREPLSLTNPAWEDVYTGYAAVTKTYTLQNSGSANLNFTASASGEGGFTVYPASGTIRAGGNVAISVTFPAGNPAGRYSGELKAFAVIGEEQVTAVKNIEITVKQNTYVLSLKGEEFPAETQTAGEYTAVSRTFTLKNEGNSKVTGLRAVMATGADFSCGGLTKTELAPGETTTITVTFPAGKGAGTYGDTLSVTGDNGTQASKEVSVKVGKKTDVTVSPSVWTEHTLVGNYTAPSAQFVIWNNGTKPITGVTVSLSGLSDAGCYYISGSVPGSISGGSSASFSVLLKAGLKAQVYTGTLVIHAAELEQDITIPLKDTVKSGIKVTFMSAEQDQPITEVNVASGGKASFDGLLPAKTMSGSYYYEFAGWTENATASNRMTNVLGSNGLTTASLVDLTAKTFTKDTALYAVFTKHYSANVDIAGSCTASAGQLLSEMYNTSGVSIYKQLEKAVADFLGSANTPASVKFGAPYSSTYGQLYASSTKASVVGTTSSYYFSSSAYGDRSLSSVFFGPTTQAGTYQIPYEAKDIYGNSVRGLISIASKVNGMGDVNYTVSHKGTVAISASDFTSFFIGSRPSYTMKWVRFSSPRVTMGSTYGSLYYNYGKSGQTQFTNTSLSNTNFYVSNNTYGAYPLSGLTFVPGTNAADYTFTVDFTAYADNNVFVTGTLVINVTDGYNITYSVDHKGTVNFKGADFNKALRNKYPTLTLSYVMFGAPSQSLGQVFGNIYYDYNAAGSNAGFTATTLQLFSFYYSTGMYTIDKLTFVPGNYGTDYTVAIPYTAYADSSHYVTGTLVIEVKDGSDVTYTVKHGSYVTMKAADFEAFLKKTYPSLSLNWVRFGGPSLTLGSFYGNLYNRYGTSSQSAFTNSSLTLSNFYASSNAYGQYALNELTFVTGTCNTDYTVSIPFTACYSSAYYVEGTLTIKVSENGLSRCDIVYNTRGTTPISITAADVEKFFKESYPSQQLSYITLGGVPETGTLYYNYGGTSRYGSTTAIRLTAANCSAYAFYVNPANTNNYSIYDLSYVPSGSNYSVQIPFTAYGTLGSYVSGTIVVCVTSGTYNDVYLATVKNTAVSLSPASFYSAVSTATSGTLRYIQFLKLPSDRQGTLYYSYVSASNFSHKVISSNSYYYTSGTYQLANVSFVPASGFTGNVEIPFAAYDASDKLLCVGTLSVGVVNKIASYKDVTSSTWYYKYITELSNRSVINGYPDGSFKPSGNVTYAEALKLILTATGYGEQARISASAHWASGYVEKAVSLGLYTSAEAKDLNLDSAITRQEVARLAARAMKLQNSTISSPFSDTSDGAILALYQAGIIEGSFTSTGLRYFYPSNSITRAEVSAIIWRINNYS